MIETKFPLEKKNTHEVIATSPYLKVIDSIKENIHDKTRVIVLTGESGTGKTLVTRTVIKDLESESYTAFLQDPRFAVDEMLASACEQIGVAAEELQNELDDEKKPQLFYKYLKERSQEKGPVRIFIDDAQDINIDKLFIILKLLEEQPDANSPLQIILIGLPQLEQLLIRPELSELNIANPVYLCLKPLANEEVGAFITQRLHAFGIEQDDFFSKEVVAKFVLYTRGIPSLVDILFDSVIEIMKLNEHCEITADIVDEAVDLFSLPWASENKNLSAIQASGIQEKVGSKKSTQASLSNEVTKIDKKTLIADIRGKVTNLFSQNKIVSHETASANRIDANNINAEEEIFDALAKELRDQDLKGSDNTNNIEEEKFTDLTEKLKLTDLEKNSNGINIEEKRLNILAEGLLHQDSDQNNGKYDIRGENSEGLMEMQNHQENNKDSESIPPSPIQQNNQVKTMNVQEETMNRSERLNKVLKALRSGSPDVEAVALISEDGLMIANALPQDLDEIRVGGMSATLLSLGTRSSTELRRGKVEEIIVRGEQGYTVMRNAGRGTLLLVVTNENAKLGLVFFDMHEAIEKIAAILSSNR